MLWVSEKHLETICIVTDAIQIKLNFKVYCEICNCSITNMDLCVAKLLLQFLQAHGDTSD